MTLGTVTPRNDGKFLVEIHFLGAANAFGGFYPGKTFRKIVTAEKLAELRAQAEKSRAPVTQS